MKKISDFLSEILQFSELKFSIYLNSRFETFLFLSSPGCFGKAVLCGYDIFWVSSLTFKLLYVIALKT